MMRVRGNAALRPAWAALILATAFVAAGQQPQTPPATGSVAPIGAGPPAGPQLPADLAAEVASDETAVSDALQHIENIDALAAAIPKAEHALEVRRARQGETWWQTIDARNTLADLRRFSTMPAVDRSALAQALEQNNQIMQFFNDRKVEEAAKLLLSTAETKRRILGEDSRGYADALNSVASLYGVMRCFDQAEQLNRQAMEIRKKTEGEAHPDYAKSLIVLGMLYFGTGRREQAEPLLRQALEIRGKALGEQHPDYLWSLTNLADVEKLLGHYRDAEALYRRAAEIRKQALGRAASGLRQ